MTSAEPTIDLTYHGDPATVAEAARAMEQGSVGGLFFAEARSDPFVSIALATTGTTRLPLGTSVAIAFARTPMSMAYSAYDVHRISGGRTILGLGTQIKPHVMYRYGMPWSAPAERMREYVAALRAIWHSWQTGDTLDFRGDFYTHTLMPPLFSPGPLGHPDPPIWLAAVGPRMVEVAGAVADGIICHPFISQSYLRDVLTPQLHASAKAAGRTLASFTTATMAMVASGRTSESLAEATLATKRQIGFYASTPAYRPVLEHHGWQALHDEAHAMSKSGRWAELDGLIDDEVLHTLAVVGEPAAIAPELRARFGGLADRVIISMAYEEDGRLGLDVAS